MKHKTTIVASLVLVAALLLGTFGGARTAYADPEVTLSLATKMAEDSFEGQTFQYFADKVAEYTDGAVFVQIYPSEQLGDSTTTVTNLQLGTVDMYVEGLTYMSPFSDKFEAISSLPFLAPSWESYVELVQGPFGDSQEADLEQAGLTILNTNRNWQRGPYYVLCSKKPIETPEDLKGLRLRTHDSALFMDAMSKIGTNPLVVAYSETYSALQQGTVEACICPISNLESMAFYEQAPNVCRFDTFVQELAIVMNKAKLESLTPEQQEAMVKAANETADYSNSELLKAVEEIIANTTEKGAIFHDTFDISPLTQMLTDSGFYQEKVDSGVLPKEVADAWLK